MKGDLLMDNQYKEVYFDQYCNKCKNKKVDVNESPCSECLDDPVNLYSHKPVKFEEKRVNNTSLYRK